MDKRTEISSKYCPRFGEIAIEQRFITKEELKAALCQQIDDEVAGRKRRYVGTILF